MDFSSFLRLCEAPLDDVPEQWGAFVATLREHPEYADSEDSQGWSPLIMCAKANNIRAVKLLIQHHGVSPNPKRELAHSALRAAALGGHSALVEYLIAEKADVDVMSEGMRTPLMGAARNGHEEILRALLRAGARVELKNTFGETAELAALSTQQSKCAEILREFAHPETEEA